MKRSLLLFAVLASLLAPSHAWGGTPYSIEWRMLEENPTCETAALGAHDGDPFFHVNQTPLPTYQVPGAFRI